MNKFDSMSSEFEEKTLFLKGFKEILLEIAFVEEMISTWGNKEMPLTFYTIPFIRKNKLQFNPFNSTISNHTFCNILTSQKADFAKFLAN